MLAIGAISLAFFLLWEFYLYPTYLYPDYSDKKYFQGMSYDLIISKFGTTSNEYKISYGDPVIMTEFHGAIYNYFPPNNPLLEDKVFLVMQYEYHYYNLTFWLHEKDKKWIVFDSLQWPSDMQF